MKRTREIDRRPVERKRAKTQALARLQNAQEQMERPLDQIDGSGNSVLESPNELGLSLSRIMTVADCEPTVWAGEVVMSRAEYREFRQHFRAMTYIFRDVDWKTRA